MDAGTTVQARPASGSSLIALLYAARALRGFGDGFAIIILPAYMTALGFDAVAVGLVATASLLGTALFTLAIGWIASRTPAYCAAGSSSFRPRINSRRACLLR